MSADAGSRRAADFMGSVAMFGALLAAAACYSSSYGVGFRLDDAYIVLNNAEALFDEDSAFPDAPPFLGSTSLLHTLALSFLGLLMPLEIALWVLSWSAVFVCALGAFRIGRECGLGQGPSVLLAAVLLSTGSPILIYLNGVETGWAIATTTWILVMMLERRRGRLAALAAVAPFVRPELAILSALVMAPRAWVVVRGGTGWRSAVREFAVGAAVVAMLSAVQIVLHGALVPGTGETKAIWFATDNNLNEIRRETLAQFAAVFAFPLIGVVFLRGAIGFIALTFAILLVVIFIGAYPEIAWHYFLRYFYLIVPVAILGLSMGLSTKNRVHRRVAAVMVALTLSLNIIGLARSADEHARQINHAEAARRDAAVILSKLPEPDRPLLIHDIGAPSFLNDRLLIDMVGLRTRCAATLLRNSPRGSAADHRYYVIAELLRRSGARFVVVSRSWNEELLLAQGLSARGIFLRREFVDRDIPWYEIYEVAEVSETLASSADAVSPYCRVSPIS